MPNCLQPKRGESELSLFQFGMGFNHEEVKCTSPGILFTCKTLAVSGVPIEK